MSKTLDDYFTDWESDAFGFGYGSGEKHTIPALKKFLENTPEKWCYNYVKLEQELTPTVAWLMINILCQKYILEYGTSPRGAWLTKKGIRLRHFILSKTDEELYELTSRDEDYIVCYPNVCNCGPNGYQKGVVCQNPFWTD